MSHFAEIDENNKVIRVLVGDNNDANGDEGYQWLIDNLGGRWIKTSYNHKIRGIYAGIGMTYSEEEDIFIIEKPFPSWVRSGSIWLPPYPMPEDGKIYDWNEETGEWLETDPF